MIEANGYAQLVELLNMPEVIGFEDSPDIFSNESFSTEHHAS